MLVSNLFNYKVKPQREAEQSKNSLGCDTVLLFVVHLSNRQGWEMSVTSGSLRVAQLCGRGFMFYTRSMQIPSASFQIQKSTFFLTS